MMRSQIIDITGMVKDQESRRSYHKLCCFHGHQTFTAITRLSRITSHQDLSLPMEAWAGKPGEKKAWDLKWREAKYCTHCIICDAKYHFSAFWTLCYLHSFLPFNNGCMLQCCMEQWLHNWKHVKDYISGWLGKSTSLPFGLVDYYLWSNKGPHVHTALVPWLLQ